MNTRTKLSLTIGALLLGGTAIGGIGVMGAAVAGASDEAAATREAARSAKQAEKALAKRDAAAAIAAAENAVAFDADEASHRALLGSAYLSAGRFMSAAQALDDALTLDPSNGRAALNLALAQIAIGDWQTARETLSSHAAHIAPADRGLALALAGDPMGGVNILGEVARDPSADAKVRQNLALALALAGRWPEAKTIAAIDLSPADVDARILEWAKFARPGGAADQVASLLGVTPAEDLGQPVRLALNPPAEVMAAVSQPATTATASIAAADIAPAPAAASPITAGGIVFAARREIVQPIPIAVEAPVRTARVDAPAHKPAAAPAAPRSFAKGQYHVQLGAYDNAGVARDAWGRLSRRVAVLKGQAPHGVGVSAGGRDFYRLSVGGFARADADAVCRSVRASGNRCFVRTQAGDKLASWAQGERYAAR
ncbi:SPOR domain-containing protein [Sphingomonas baiyangensis]|uniref:Tetratricopeptide repeat protein n=1 Tax=Sphingomonas baiyangensis TaxID=2572576 RepID=A0A4U1L266_9SPHN|nr:SPOR domain-containing protein [Sphingomonas baiyangensis]TKD50075.1 tetratricopeptide repeat protein [Sphingomonas baiyangensis]